jgi:hypothetical protein
VEEEFCELPLTMILGSWANKDAPR